MGLGADLKAAKEALELVNKVVSDKETVEDLKVILTAADRELKAAQNHSAATPSLKAAFNTASGALGVANDYIRTRKVPLMTLVKNKNKYQQAGEVISEALNAQNPAVTSLVAALEQDVKLQEATLRIAARNPEIVGLERGADGVGYGVEKVSGQNIRLPLDQEQYAAAEKAFAAEAAKRKGQQGPKFGA